MDVNHVVNEKAAAKGAWQKENAQVGKWPPMEEREFEAEGIRAASYDGRQRTSKIRSQNGLDSGTYKASGARDEQDKELIEKNKEESEDANEALDKVANTMTEEDCEDLMAEGMTLEAYEAERLSQAIARIKENREFAEENLEGRIDKQKEYDKEIQKIVLKNKVADSTARRLGQKLIDAGLPVTEANVMAMVQALDMGSSVNTLSDNGMAHMIGTHQEATIENIHKASYAGTASVPTDEKTWEAVKGQVGEIIEQSGRSVTEETLEDGKWLLDHELPVTDKSLEDLENLKGIREKADEDYLIDRMTEAVRQGKSPKEANLDLETIRYRRKLEEIRLSMSEGASKSLEEKGIIIDTEHMKEVVEELRRIEKAYYKALLSEAGETTEPNKVNLLQEILEKTKTVGQGPAYVLGRTFETRQKETLDTLYHEGEAMKQRDARLREAYEPLWMSPNEELGDSIQKAFQNTTGILSEMGLEGTEENQRAVRILGYNRMGITEENINNVKLYDAKVNEVLSGLKPAVAIELIRRGVNPLNMPFDELGKIIKGIKESIGADSEEKYSMYLWKLEKQGEGITEEERKSYLGIYRLLNNIEKTDGAAVGAVLNTKRELTLSNLLTAVRILKSDGIDQKVDDGFGGLAKVSFSAETIPDQINSAFRLNSKVDYLQTLVERTMEDIAPEQVMGTVKEAGGEAVMDMSLESFCEKTMAQEKDEKLTESYHKEQMEMVQEIADDSELAVDFLRSYGVGKTIRNVQAAQMWFSGKKNLFKEIAEKADNTSEEDKIKFRSCTEGLLDVMEDEASLKAEYQRAADTMKSIVAKGFSDLELDADGADALRMMQKGITLATRISKKEHYEMPVMIGDEVSSLSLTILKGTLDSGKVDIRIDFPAQGLVEAELSIKNNEIKGFILCETTDGQKLIKSCLGDLKAGFEGLGLKVKQLNASTGRASAKLGKKETKPEDAPTETRILYQAAKLLVKQTIERTQVIGNEN